MWEKFEAVEIDRQVYMLNVPLKLRPVGLVNRVHRRRARARRGYWDEIIQSARESMAKYRTLPSSDPSFATAVRRGAAFSGADSSLNTMPLASLLGPATAASGPDGKPSATLPNS